MHSTAEGCPLHGLYFYFLLFFFLLRTTWANRSGGNHKWECNGAERDPERVYWRKESKGEDAMERTSVSWELFLISQDESRALSPENRHSGPFSKKKKKKIPSTLTPTSSHSALLVPLHCLLQVSQFSLSLTLLLSHLFSHPNFPL